MLVLARHRNESIVIRCGDETIRITVVELRPRSVRLGVTAADHVMIDREEIADAKSRETLQQMVHRKMAS